MYSHLWFGYEKDQELSDLLSISFTEMKMDFLPHLQEELNYNIDIKAPFIFNMKKEETKKTIS